MVYSNFDCKLGNQCLVAKLMEKTIHTREYALLIGMLRAHRLEIGMTQLTLAARLGVTQAFISKCERAERRMDVVELVHWCQAMGTSAPAFLQAFMAASSCYKDAEN